MFSWSGHQPLPATSHARVDGSDTLYQDQGGHAPRTFNVNSGSLPSWAQPSGRFTSMSKYFGMVKCIDDNIGRMLDTLRKHDLLEKTIIVFTSDHGDLRGEHHRQNKGVPFEGSAKIPFLMYYADVIPAGLVINEALSCVDFLPTVLKLMESVSTPALCISNTRCSALVISRASAHALIIIF